jgi:aspartate 1-decarboxylase
MAFICCISPLTAGAEGDTTAPVITLNGAASMLLAVGGSFTDPGATALDDVDGDISGSVVVGGDTVDTNTAGAYVITYDVSDAAGNPAVQVTRTVRVVVPTVISVEPPTSVENKDVEFTVEIKVAPGEPISFVQVDVRYNRTVLQTKKDWVVEGDLFNRDGAATIFGKNVKDSQGLIDNIICMRPAGSPPVAEEGILARITFKAKAAGTTDITFEGVKVQRLVDPVNLIYEDEPYETIKGTVTVIIPDTTPPVITLNGAASMTLAVGDSFTDPGATASDNVDGDISGSVVVGGGTVDANTAGTYVITYDVSDAAGNPAVQVTRTVTVIIPDTTPPVITLNGAASMTLAVGDSFTDPGATASDNVDGDISGSVVVGGDTVDTSTAGTYVITYDVSDAAGNPAQEVTRTVIVRDTQIPDWDVNQDGLVNVLDMIRVGQHFNESGAAGWIREDANKDGVVNVLDLISIGQCLSH